MKNREVIVGTHQDSTSGLLPQKVCAVPVQENHYTETSQYTTVPILLGHNCLECFAVISITTLLGDTTAAMLAALPRLPPLLLPSMLMVPPWIGWLSRCCIPRLFKDGGDQEICGGEYRKCRVGIKGSVGEGDMEKRQFWL